MWSGGLVVMVRGAVTGADGQGYRLRLLGGFRLTQGDAEVELPVAAQRVVAVAALRGRLSRSRLAGMLWPETTEHRALASLRTAIWRVNRMAPVLIAPVTSVALDSQVLTDVNELVAMSHGEASAIDIDADVAGAHHRASELLPDWDDEWLIADRERLRQLRLHLIESVAEGLIARGNFGLAIEAAMAAVCADNLRESAHRLVIRAHLAEGNVNEARRAYRICRTLLLSEAGVEPSRQTRHIFDV